MRAIQNFDGGWGESCESYKQGTYVAAPARPPKPLGPILALLAGGDTTSTSLHDGIEYLIRHAEGATAPGTRNWPPAPDSRSVFYL